MGQTGQTSMTICFITKEFDLDDEQLTPIYRNAYTNKKSNAPCLATRLHLFSLSFNKLKEATFKTRCWVTEAHRGVNHKSVQRTSYVEQ
jgi:hypothetical protein